MKINIRAKKFLVVFVAFAIMLSNMIFVSNVSAATDAYELIEATSYDRSMSKASKEAAYENKANRVGSVWADGYLVYPSVDFGNTPPIKVSATAGARTGFATALLIRIDAPDSEPVATIPITVDNFSVGYTNTVPLSVNITGVHDVYVTTQSSTMNFFNFQFHGIEPEKISYGEYSGEPVFFDLADSDLKKDVNMLWQLGIIKGDKGSEFTEDMPVTRGDFARSVYGIYAADDEGEDEAPEESKFSDVAAELPAAEAIEFLSDNGIMNGVGDDKFEPGRFITPQDAATVILRVLGYGKAAEQEGGYPTGYKTLAVRKKLLNTTALSEGVLTKRNLVILMRNALQTEFLFPSGVKDDYVKYETQEGILSDTRSIYFGSGKVIANAYTSLDLPETDTELGYVVIGNNTYKAGNTGAPGLLGVECDFYYEVTENERIIKAIEPQDDAEMVDISSAKDKIYEFCNEKIEYILDGTDEEETIYFSSAASVIYNGIAAEQSIESLVDFEETFTGHIRVFENSDGSQVIKIDEYDDYIIESINLEFNTFKCAYNKGTLNWTERDIVFIENGDGEETKAKDLKINDILTVYESKNSSGKKLIRIFAADETITGTVTGIEDGEYYIDGTKRTISNNAEKPTVGQTSAFRLNIYGDVVHADVANPDVWKLGLFMGYSVKDTGFEKDIEVKIITEDAKTEIYEVAEKIVADGNKIDSASVITNGESGIFRGFSSMMNSDGTPKEEIVRYRINSDNKLSAIDTKEKRAGGKEDTLTQLHENKSLESKTYFSYNRAVKTLYSKSENSVKYYLPNEAAVFTFYGNPGDSDRESKALVGTAYDMIYSTGHNVWGDIYAIGDNKYQADVVVWKSYTDSLKMLSHFVFESLGTGIDEDGDIIDIVKGWHNGLEVTYKLDLSGKVALQNPDAMQRLKTAKPGDVFQIKLHSNNTLSFASLWCLAGCVTKRGDVTPTISTKTNKTGNNEGARGICGEVVYRTEDYISVKLSDTETEIVPLSGAGICRVEKTDDKVFVEKAKEPNIEVGNTVFVYSDSTKPATIVVYDGDWNDETGGES